MLELVVLWRGVTCEVVDSSELFVTGKGLGTPSRLAPNATGVSKTPSRTTSGLYDIIPHDIQPLVSMSTVPNLDQAATKISPKLLFSKIPSWIVFHPLVSFCDVVDFRHIKKFQFRGCS